MRPEQQETQWLQREGAKITAEREILEKTAAQFAKNWIRGLSLSRSTEGYGRHHDFEGNWGARAMAFMPSLAQKRQRARSMISRSAARSSQAFSSVIEHTARVVSGMMLWLKARVGAYIASNA